MLGHILRRPGLLLAAALIVPFVGAVLVGTTRAQPFGPGGIPRPPGAPGSPFGPGGGISGLPHGPGGGIHGIPNPPGFPGDPFERPGLHGGITGGGIRGGGFGGGGLAGGGIAGGGFGGGGMEWEFKCSGCNRVLGHSKSAMDKPPYDKCPHCGVRFINGGSGWNRGGSTFKPEAGGGAGGGIGGGILGGGQPRGAPPPNLGGGGFTPPPGIQGGGMGPGLDNDDWGEDEEEGTLHAPFGKRMLLAGIVGFVGLVVILGVVGLIFLVGRAAGGGSKRRHPRRRRTRDYEPQEEEYEEPQPRSRVRRY